MHQCLFEGVSNITTTDITWWYHYSRHPNITTVGIHYLKVQLIFTTTSWTRNVNCVASCAPSLAQFLSLCVIWKDLHGFPTTNIPPWHRALMASNSLWRIPSPQRWNGVDSFSWCLKLFRTCDRYRMRLASKRSSESDSHKKVRKRDMLLKFRVNERSTHPDSKQPKQLELLRFWTWQVLAISLAVVSPDDIPTWHLQLTINYYESLQPTTRTAWFFWPFLTSWVTLHLSDRLLGIFDFWGEKIWVTTPILPNLRMSGAVFSKEKGNRCSRGYVYVCVYIYILYTYIYIYSKHAPSTWVQVLHCEVAVGKNASHLSIMSQNIKSVSKLPSFIKTSMVLPKKIGGFHLSPRIFTNS